MWLMPNKIKIYKDAALENPVYLCVPILDPCQRLSEIFDFTLKPLGWVKEDRIEFDIDQADAFKTSEIKSPNIQIIKSDPDTGEEDQPFYVLEFCMMILVRNQVKEYLELTEEEEGCDVPHFWKKNKC